MCISSVLRISKGDFKKIDDERIYGIKYKTTLSFRIRKFIATTLFPVVTEKRENMKELFRPIRYKSILLYGCTTWTLTKRLEKKLDGNYTRMLRAILNKSWRQHPTKHQLYGHLPPITKTIQVRWTRHVLLWTPTYGWAKAGRPART